MTLIELCLVMGIVAGLIALVLGLGRHVNEVIKIRRAQADLGEWHETLNTWYLKFGMYPDPSAPPFNVNGPVDSNIVWLASSKEDDQYYAELPTQPRFPFCSLASKPLHTTDPWGTVYVYQSFTNSYILFSCGPNGVHEDEKGNVIPENTRNIPSEPNIDDIYFEL